MLLHSEAVFEKLFCINSKETLARRMTITCEAWDYVVATLGSRPLHHIWFPGYTFCDVVRKSSTWVSDFTA